MLGVPLFCQEHVKLSKQQLGEQQCAMLQFGLFVSAVSGVHLPLRKYCRTNAADPAMSGVAIEVPCIVLHININNIEK